MHDSAFTGKTLCLEAAVTSKLATYGDLVQAVLVELRISARDIPVSLQMAGKEMHKEAPLDINVKPSSDFPMLSLCLGGLQGGSLSPRRDIDDEFKRAPNDGAPI